MQDDDELVDQTLLVETALGAPDLTYAALYSPAREFLIYAIPIGLILIAIVGGLVYAAPHGSADKALTVMGSLLMIGVWAKWVLVMGILLYPAYKIWSAAGDRPVSKVTHHLFTRDGVEIVGASGSSLMPWPDFSRVIETPKGFMFYRQSKIATFVPRRCLEGDAEIAIVRKFISTNVVNAKLLA